MCILAAAALYDTACPRACEVAGLLAVTGRNIAVTTAGASAHRRLSGSMATARPPPLADPRLMASRITIWQRPIYDVADAALVRRAEPGRIARDISDIKPSPASAITILRRYPARLMVIRPPFLVS